MEKNPVEVYLGQCSCIEEVDPSVGTRAVFRHLEALHAYDKAVDWEAWFKERPEELNRIIGILQNDPSYNTYSEHVLNGMGYWDKALLVTPANLSNVDVFGHMVAPATWHKMGQRDNGKTLRLMADLSASMGLTWGRKLAFRTPHSTALAFYQGSLEAAVESYRSGNSHEKLERWCKQASTMTMLDTWQLFVERYPDCSALLVCYCIQKQQNPGVVDFLAQWAIDQPAQHALMYAFVQQSPIPWALSEDVTFGTDIQARTRDVRLLLSSLLTPTHEPVEFFRACAGMHLDTSFASTATLALPEGLNL